MSISGVPQNSGTPWAKIFGFGALGCVVVVGIVVFLIYRFVSKVIDEVMTEETFSLANASNFDPFAGLSEITPQVGSKAKLISIDATGVRPDGTMDLTAEYTPAPRATYQFIEPTEKDKEKMPPVGAGRGPDDIWARVVKAEAYRPGQRSHITRRGGSVNAEYYHTNQGVTVTFETPRASRLTDAVAAPSLSTREMWQKALSLGAPKDAVARVSYDVKGYDFVITGMGYSLHWEVNGEFDEDSRYPGKK